jgi:hypothetical protein
VIIAGCILAMIVFIVVLLPTMILVELFNLVPSLKRNPIITYWIGALFVVVVTAFALASFAEVVFFRCLGSGLVLIVLVLDYQRRVTAAATV